MKLLVDHNISYRIARALHALFEPEHEIIAKIQLFPKDAQDVDWIGELHRRGSWAALTMDISLRTRPHERAAMDASRVMFFFLDGAWRKTSVAEKAARLIRLVPKMAAQVDLADRGRFALPFNAGSKLRPHRD